MHIDHIDEYPVAYLPYPVMLSAKTVEKLRTYVKNGGTLISEGLVGYFGDHGHAGTVQPNQGLDEVFGAREADVEFTPDLLEDLTWKFGGHSIGGRFFRQVYRPTTGAAVGWYSDGTVAAVENRFGKGRALLIGSFPAASYFRKQQPDTRRVFQDFLAGQQRIKVTDPAVIARLHEGAGGTVLWVMNPTRSDKSTIVHLNRGSWQKATDLWGNVRAEVKGASVSLTVPARDAAVLRLE